MIAADVRLLAERDALREALVQLLSYIDCGRKTWGPYGDYTNVTFSPTTVEVVRAHCALGEAGRQRLREVTEEVRSYA